MSDLRTLTDGTTIRPHGSGILLDELRECRLQILVMAIHRQHVSGLSSQDIADRHLTTTCLVEHLHVGAIAESGLARYLESCYVVDHHIVTDVVVRDTVPHAVDDDSIADGTIDQPSVRQAVGLVVARLLLGGTTTTIVAYLTLTDEVNLLTATSIKVSMNANQGPVLRLTSLLRELFDLFCIKLSHR